MKRILVIIICLFVLTITVNASAPVCDDAYGVTLHSDGAVTFEYRSSVRLPAKWYNDNIRADGKYSICVYGEILSEVFDYGKMKARVTVSDGTKSESFTSNTFTVGRDKSAACEATVSVDTQIKITKAYIELENSNANELFDICIYGVTASKITQNDFIFDKMINCVVYKNAGGTVADYVDFSTEAQYISYAGFNCVLHYPECDTAKKHIASGTKMSLAYIIGDVSKEISAEVLSDSRYLKLNGNPIVFFENEKAYEGMREYIKGVNDDTLLFTACGKGDIQINKNTVVYGEGKGAVAMATEFERAMQNGANGKNVSVFYSWDIIAPRVEDSLKVNTEAIDRFSATLHTTGDILRTLYVPSEEITPPPQEVTPSPTEEITVAFSPNTTYKPTSEVTARPIASATVKATDELRLEAYNEEAESGGNETIIAAIISVGGLFLFGGVKILYKKLTEKRQGKK